MDGVLNIDKPAGMSSHDVVLQVRRLVREKRIGHTGTLDPLATGVLVLCLGRATRIARYLEAGIKEYEATMRLGIATDTLDAEGSVIENRTYQPPAMDRVLDTLQQFTGEIVQTPPSYSAIKVGGVASYKLARQGKAVALAPRTVVIHALELREYADPHIRISVRCSKGVYVRSLCADIGNALGAGAHMTSLRRTASGSFYIADAVTLDELARAAGENRAEERMLSIDQALAEFAVSRLDQEDAKKIMHGVRIPVPRDIPQADSGLVRIHDPEGVLVAIGSIAGGVLRPMTVFCHEGSDGRTVPLSA